MIAMHTHLCAGDIKESLVVVKHKQADPGVAFNLGTALFCWIQQLKVGYSPQGYMLYTA